MPEILRIATSVATPLALLGLVAALGYLAYVRRLQRDEAELQALPSEERAHATDEYLTRYGIDGRDLPPDDRSSLIREEMEKRHQRAIWYLAVTAVVFIFCFAIAVMAFMSGSNSTGDANASTTGTAESEKDLATESEQPEFTVDVQFSTDDAEGSVESVEFVSSNAVDIVKAKSFLRLKQIEVDVRNDLYRITLGIHNPWTDPMVLDLTSRYFKLQDDTGYEAQLVHARYPEPRSLLAGGDSRVVTLYFRGEGWIGKNVTANSIIFETRGLTPIIRASWRIPVLVTGE